MTQLWFAPVEIDGRAEIQEGFKTHIINNLNQAREHFSEVQSAIDKAKKAMIHSEFAKSTR
jgi:DNA-binding HxlR family transcriptional regulator